MKRKKNVGDGIRTHDSLRTGASVQRRFDQFWYNTKNVDHAWLLLQKNI